MNKKIRNQKESQRIQNTDVCDISALPLHRKTVFLTQKKAVEYENGISYLFATKRSENVIVAKDNLRIRT